ncbi:MAG: translation elongation factor Ts [Planctomycetes bacterium]|nr:translation elongation factor Ts [Planctomycetota bacterium]
MTISASDVSKLRERTGAGLMECKRALEACNGDLEAAVDFLRKSGLKNADKRAGRKAGAGRVASHVAADGKRGAMVLMTSETDFVPPTDDFKALLGKLAQLAFEKRVGSAGALLEQPLDGGTALDAVKRLTAKCGENVEVPLVCYFENAKGVVGGYIHHDNKTAGFASVTTDKSGEKVADFLKNLGMHITFAKPIALSREQIPAEAVEREKAVYRESEEVLSKPEDKREKIVQGKLEKFFGGIALIEQPWFKDDKSSVKKMLAQELGADAKIEAFALFQVGA